MDNKSGPSPDQPREVIPLIEDYDPYEAAFLQPRLNQMITRLNELDMDRAKLLMRLDVSEKALLRMIQKFENHSHNHLGLAVVPASS